MSIPQHPVCWAEIPVRDLEAAKAFYETVLDTELKINDAGPNPMADIPSADGNGVSGHLYPGKPARHGEGPTVHLVVDDLEAAIARVVPAGGKVLSDPITIPPGRFAYCNDPDGNSIGLFAFHQG